MAITVTDRRRMKSDDPATVLRGLMGEIEVVQRKIDEVLSGMVDVDREQCPGVPRGVLKNLRTARSCGGYCACSWLKSEAEKFLGDGE